MLKECFPIGGIFLFSTITHVLRLMNQTVAIYSKQVNNRLQYVADWIFREQLGISYRLMTDIGDWKNAEGIKINYSKANIADALHIIPAAVLFQNDVQPQQLSIGRWKRSTVLFYNNPKAELPFDIFAAVFYLVARYEEYLPHTVDKHGRYRAEASVAGRYSFLQRPVVDEWVMHFKEIIESRSGVELPQRQFTAKFTYDIDMAWSYLHKGLWRNLGNIVKDFARLDLKAIAARNNVLKGHIIDPFYSFDRLDLLHQQYHITPVYFFLLGQYGKYDKNITPSHPAMQQLIAATASKYDMGIHPSYASHQHVAVLQKEIDMLSGIIHQPVTKSRQHYIKFSLPDTYRILIQTGIRDDYSMGYASDNGFRAGTSNSFLWFDIEKDEGTGLRVHPFAFMDATCIFYKKQNAKEMLMEWESLFHAVKNVNGTFIQIWHNYTLGTDKAFKGIWELYLQLTDLTITK